MNNELRKLLEDVATYQRKNKSEMVLLTEKAVYLAGLARTGHMMEEVVDNVREALGQEETHYLVIADDVATVVQALEKIEDIARKFRIGMLSANATKRIERIAGEALRRIRHTKKGKDKGRKKL